MSQKLESGTFQHSLREFKEKLIPGLDSETEVLLSNSAVIELLNQFWYDGYTNGYSYGFNDGYDEGYDT